ncbi:MAG TPA: hypothetical protein DEF51_19310 [Myxococcales bacterium]|nr:hypothetical protein [Myxococcales bacterium]
MRGTLLSISLAALASTGCFDNHGRGDPTPPGADAGLLPTSDAGLPPAVDYCECCGVTVEIPAGEDCELGWCDPYCLFPPPVVCDEVELRALDLICPSFVPAGQPTRIPVAIGGDGECYCGEQVLCDAQLGAEPFVLEIESSICAEGALCEACFPYIEAECELPPMETGTWTVRANGEDLFQLSVAPAGTMPEWGLECVHRRGEDRLGCGTDWPPRRVFEPTSACHPEGAYPEERVTFTVTDGCAGCGTIEGPCEVEVFDDVVRLRPSRVETQCDVDCPTVCMPMDHTCVSPPLPEGTWRVFLEDVELGTRIEVASPPGTTDEVCGEVLGG